jgi:hypothetical protein
MNLTVKAQIPLKAEDIFIGVFDSQEEVWSMETVR